MCKIAIMDSVGSKAGMDYYDSSLMKGLQHQGCETIIYSNYTGIDSASIVYKQYFDAHSHDNALIKLYKIVKATIKASADAKKNKIDLVILHLFSASSIGLVLKAIPKCFGLKIALISHDVSSFADNDNSFAQNIIYNTFADYIIVHNQFSYDTLMNNIDINKPEKVTIIKHGGYLDHIGKKPDKASVRKVLGLEPDGKYILFFGQIKEVKGLDILLEAMSKVSSDIKLIIAGKPWKADFSAYDELIEKYKLQDRIVKMICFIEDDEREKLFFAADVNVLPYRIIYQSGVLLMAMSHGLPVIASDLPANKEIIKNGKNGILFKSEDVDDLTEQINSFFQDNFLQESMTKEALITIRDEYGWNKIAESYIKMVGS